LGSVALLWADTISNPISIAIPTGLEGQLLSTSVSIAIPAVLEKEGNSAPVSFAIPTGLEGQLLSPSVTLQVQPANVGDPDLVGLWHFDGDPADSSGRENHVTPVNGVVYVADAMVGTHAAKFNGINTYFRASSGNYLPLGNSPRTFSAWIKPFSYPDSTYNGIFAYGQGCTSNGSLLSIKNDGRLSMAFWCNDATQTEGPTTVLNEWNHVAFTYNGGTTVKFYMNGQFVQESSVSSATPATTQNGPIRIGSTDDPGRVFNGLIDEVAIYKRALTAEEILGQYNRAVLESRPPAKPVVNATPAITAVPLFTVDGSKEAQTSIWINGQKKVEISADTDWHAQVTLNSGSNLLSIIARNADGIESSPLLLPVILDNVAPTVLQKTPTEGAQINQPNPAISFQLQDTYSALDLAATTAAASVTADGYPLAGTWSISGNNTVVFTSTVAPALEGTYRVTIQPTDVLGNATTATLTFTIDTTPPPTPVINVPTGPVASAVTLTGTRSADASTLSITSSSGSVGTVTYPTATTWRVTLSGVAEGEVTITAVAGDAAGNRSPAAAIILLVDTTPPGVPTVDAVDSPTTATAILLAGGKETDSVLYLNFAEVTGVFADPLWSAPVSLHEGSNTFTLYAQDSAGNKSSDVSVAVVRDTTAPTISVATPVPGSSVAAVGNIVVTLSDSFSAVDLAASLTGATVRDSAGSEIAGSWSVVGSTLVFTPLVTLVDQSYTVTLHPVDTLGNSGNAAFAFIVDTAMPAVTALAMSPTSPHKAETVTFTLTFSEAMDTGVPPTVTMVRERLLLDARIALTGSWLNNTTWRATYSFTSSTGDGEYAVMVAAAKDKAGNVMAEAEAGSFLLDTDAPPAPTLNPVLTPTNIATQVLAGAKPVATALYINGQQKVALNNETTWSLSYPLKEGSNPLSLASRDAAGNDSSPLTTNLILDTTPPAFTIDLWQPVTSKPTQTLSGSREPGSIVKLDGTVIVSAEDLSGNWSYPVTLVEGIATRLTFTVSDALGNVVTRTIDLLYDALAPPALVAGVLSADGNGSGSSVKLTWPAYVEPADLAYYRIYLATADFTDINGRVAVGTANKGSKTYTALSLTEGTNYFFAVEPVDISGNSESVVHTASAIPVDAAPPEEVTGLKAVAGYSAASGNFVTLNWTASKNSQGDLAEQFLYVDAGVGYTTGTALGQSTVNHSVTGLKDATLYKFKVTTTDVGGHESAGTIVSAVTRLANPTGLVAVAGKNQVTLHWNAVASPYLASYQVYRLASEQSQADVAAMTLVKSLSGTNWIDTGLSNGTVYQYAVTARNSSGAERTEVGSVAATPRQDATGPVIDSFSLAAGQVIAAPLTVAAAASDLESTMAKVELYLDGVLVATGNGAAVSWYWNVVTATDGNHTLTVVAFDALGNSSEASRNVVVSLAAPVTPRLNTHLIESTVPQTTVTASGSDALYTTVTLKVNGVVVGSIVAGASGNFTFSGLALVEGENRLAVKATHRGGDSPWSADYRITVDTGAPPAPTTLSAKALAGGSVQFTWQAGSGEVPTGYNLYVASSAFTAANAAGVSRVNTAPINYLFKEIIPANDSQRFYAVTALDGAGNESSLSNLVSSTADRSLPTVNALLFTFNQAPRPLDLAFGPGQAGVTLTLSEPLKELPFFSLEPIVGSPIVVSLTKNDELHYSGSFRIDATSPHGPTTWKFSGKDIIGNRGNQQGSGPVLDVRGPAATVSAPVALHQIAPAVAVAISFDEAPVATPVLEFKDGLGVIVPVTDIVSTGDALHWAGTVDLSTLAEGEGTFKLLSAVDTFGNLSTTVAAGQKLLLYRDAPPAPAIPQGLTAIAKAGGHIELLWKAVTGASSYRLYRRVAGEGDFALLAEQSATGFADLPADDGSYSYAVSAVGLLASESALSTEVTVSADRVAPSAPTDLALVLAGSGVQANWSAPNGDPPAASYRLYRAAAPFSSVAGLSAVATAEVTAAVDAAPSSTLRHYVVTALDSLGNESAPSPSVSIDFPVAPVKNLVLTQLEGGKPSLTWEAPQGGLQGYFIYRNGEKVVTTPTPGTSYTDGYYNGGSVSYGISALDAFGNESPIRELTLPELVIGLPSGTTLRRGLLETVPVVLTSAAATTVKEIQLKVGSSAESLLAGPFVLSAGTPLTVQKIAATPLDAGSTVAVVGTAILEPAPGTTLRLTRTSVAQVTPAGSALEIFYEPLIRGATASVRIKVNNLGSARMEFLTSENGGSTAQVIVYLKNQDGNILAEGRLDQRTGSQVVNSSGYATARIEPGASFLSEPIVFRVPESAPYAVVLEAVIANSYYHYNGSDQVSAPGMRQSTALSIADVSYSAVAQVEKENYRQGESVVLSGQAIATSDGGPMPNVPVRLGLSSKGFDRFFTLNTDETGAFRYVFTPAINEAGSYSIWAVHPELQSRTAQDTFNIYALTVSPQRFDLKLARGTSYDISVTLRNYSGIELTGLSFAATASSGLSATVINAGDNLLGGDEAQTIKLRVSALANTPNTGYVKLEVTTAEGLGGVVDVNASMCDTIPIIAVSPTYIDTGMMRGTQKVATLTIKNTGYATLNNARVTAPSTPWMSLTVPLELGSLAVGQSVSVGVLFRPDIAVPPGVYDDRIVITADNHIPYTANLQATVTSDAVGNVVFDVLNELFEDVVGANLTLQHQSLPELIYTLKTGADGTVSKFDIPEGRYSYSVSANGHKPYSGSFVVTPGLTVTVPVALEVTLVEIEWSVTETTIEDRYEIKIQQTFQTNVPTSVLVVEPPGITLPDMQPGEVFNGEFSITNYGLIKADYKGMRFPASIDDYDFEVLGNIPMTLGAMEKVIVPYRVMRRAEQ
jgi:fibronectin type 3 domain-containing protein